MLIYGKNAVREAIIGGKTINKITFENGTKDKILNELISVARKNKIKLGFDNQKMLTKKVGTPKHQGVIAEITDFNYCTLTDILVRAEQKDELPFVLVLDEIADPHNLGAIIRTAEAIGVHGIVLQKDRACAVNETVYKTSAGAISNMLIARETNLSQVLDFLKRQGLWVFGLELGGSNIYKTNLKGPIALVIGSEGFGIKDLVKKNCDEIVSLPMHGQVNSLNASVATGIALYEISRQREI